MSFFLSLSLLLLFPFLGFIPLPNTSLSLSRKNSKKIRSEVPSDAVDLPDPREPLVLKSKYFYILIIVMCAYRRWSKYSPFRALSNPIFTCMSSYIDRTLSSAAFISEASHGYHADQVLVISVLVLEPDPAGRC
ncbi:hypothetical protein BDP27DRAFT_591311 [Rhodocollybia butyracea]|uniref:Uncharacterized protein n=1 Tax=Rhodocollybia butyracea TaxID=206335 RepID=A0A9P5PY50_9AGAR|nr:hypothetical protein BDP27DRAFT_591311 [Rhodocollybia butyracea]